MKVGIIGKKLGMMQIFETNGNYIPITVIETKPCIITGIKKIEKHGYNAIQLGCFKMTPKKIIKSNFGYFLKEKIKFVNLLKEFKTQIMANYQIGQQVNIDQFNNNQKVNIQGLTIGKGNTGNIKRNHFKRGPMTHGSKHHRLQGSLGAGTSPSRVFPGKKMSGHHGAKYVTIKALVIKHIDIINNILFLKGSVPGKNGNILYIKHI